MEYGTHSQLRPWLGIGMLLGLIFAPGISGAAEPARTVFRTAFTNSLAATGAVVRFERTGPASYFDTAQQRIVTVSTNTPRFVAAPGEGKRWGVAVFE